MIEETSWESKRRLTSSVPRMCIARDVLCEPCTKPVQISICRPANASSRSWLGVTLLRLSKTPRSKTGQWLADWTYCCLRRRQLTSFDRNEATALRKAGLVPLHPLPTPHMPGCSSSSDVEAYPRLQGYTLCCWRYGAKWKHLEDLEPERHGAMVEADWRAEEDGGDGGGWEGGLDCTVVACDCDTEWP